MTIEDALAAVIRERDCPATRRLCMDCWGYSQAHGEEAGLSFAAMLLEGVRKYAAHERGVKAFWNRSTEEAQP